MNVLSLFDGMSCGQLALKRAGINYATYHASEIDKWAIRITQKNFPNTVQLGDVTKIDLNSLPPIDLLLGGSPCQGFSRAGRAGKFNDPRSGLFFSYVVALHLLKPRWFLFENVRMDKYSQNIISAFLGVEPIRINSALVSAQNRDRLYWTNIPDVQQPIDKQIYFGDIRQNNVPYTGIYYTEEALLWIVRHAQRTGKKFRIWQNNNKAQMLEASMFKKYSAQRFFGILDVYGIRYVTPVECERLQTVEDGYTEGVSNTQRYRMLGNGWTVDVISHILSHIKEHPYELRA